MFHPNDKVETIDGVALVNGTPADYAALLDHLTYANYFANRHQHGLSAELAAKYYPGAAALEARYQMELVNRRQGDYLAARAHAWMASDVCRKTLWRAEDQQRFYAEYDAQHGGLPQ